MIADHVILFYQVQVEREKKQPQKRDLLEQQIHTLDPFLFDPGNPMINVCT